MTWLIGDPVDLSVDPDAVDGDESDEPDAAAVPEVAAPVDDAPDDDAWDDELVPESAGSAHATAGVVASAIPIPSATANAPTRPMYFAVPIVVPLSMSRRNDGHRVGRVPRSESSLACGATSSVVHYCNLARFRRGTTEIARMADRAARRLRHRLVVVLGELVQTTAGKWITQAQRRNMASTGVQDEPLTLKQAECRPEVVCDFKIHELRHTAASLAIQAGAKMKALQNMLGHESAGLTLDRYATFTARTWRRSGWASTTS